MEYEDNQVNLANQAATRIVHNLDSVSVCANKTLIVPIQADAIERNISYTHLILELCLKFEEYRCSLN